MSVILDAWLDHHDGWLRILDRYTGGELMRWSGEQLRAAMNNGQICCCELEQRQLTDGELLELVASLGQQ